MVVLLCVKGLTEKVAMTLKKRGVSTAMKPHTTLRRLLVRPKDKAARFVMGSTVCGGHKETA